MNTPHSPIPSRRLLLLASLLALAVTARADLVHRYSFDESPGTTIASDFYGGSNGDLLGSADFTGTGSLVFNGSNAYVNLPNGLISALTNATFEAWVTWGGGGNWQRIFDFGTSTNGEGLAGEGQNYIFLSPRGSTGGSRFGAKRTGEAENLMLDGPALPTNVLTHVAVTYAFEGGLAKLYINGQFVAYRPATMPLSNLSDVNNWLGRSQYSGDTNFLGTMQEFRIYNSALSAAEVAASAQEGPEIDTSDPGALQMIRLSAGPTIPSWGTQPVIVLADYVSVTNVNVTAGEGVVYTSSDPNVLTIDTNGVMRAKASGTATVTATFQGQTDVKTVDVIYPYVTSLKHRYNFNELAGPAITDSISGANGTLIDPSNRCSFNGSSLYLTNTASLASSSAGGSYVDLPNGIISSLTNATFETWVTFIPVAGNWVRVFDMGNSSAGEGNAGNGVTYIFLNARTGGSGGSRFAIRNGTTETVVLNAAQLANNVQSHVVVTYSTNLGARMYINGVLVASQAAVTPLSAVVDVNNWLGRSQWGGDAYINARYNEFRIYHGVMADADVMASYLAGPEAITNAGQLQAVSLQLNPTMFGGAQQPVVLAQYPNVSNFVVTATAEITLTSSDTNVLVIAGGVAVQAVAPGTATITATYQGLSDSKPVTVLPNAGVTNLIVNRYSFSEGAGTNLTDAIGGANGTIVNPAGTNFLWTGTNLWLNNAGAGAATNAYVNLPNGIISRHTNITVETWVTWSGRFSDNWQRIFDFGSSSQGEDQAGTGRTYFLLTPRSGGTGNRIRVTMSTNSNASGAERFMEPTFTLAQNAETHVVVTYNSVGRAMSLYVNGVLVAGAVSELPIRGLNDFNNWLGRAQYGDPFFNGQYNEFRIYSDVLTERQIVASYAAGPNASFDIPVTLLAQPQSVTVGEGGAATFSVVAKGFPTPSSQWYRGGLPIPGASGPSLTLAGVTVADSGAQFFNIVSNFVNGSPVVVTSLVATLTVVNAANSLTHRYSFTSDANDSVGTAHGTLLNGATITNNMVQLVAANTNYVELPGHLIDGYPALTMEFWIDVGVNGNWARVYDFGDQNIGGLGRHYILFTPHSGGGDTRMVYSDADPGYNHEVLAISPGVLDNRGPIHVATVYDPANSTLVLYTNGVQAAIRTDFIFPLANVINTYSWLGRSLYNGDSWYQGSIDEFRIYNSALSPAKVQASYLLGPNAPLNNNAVTIVRQPQGARVPANGSATLSVTAIGALELAPLTYQWRLNGASLPDATNAALVVNNMAIGNYGPYDVVVANGGGSVTSAVASLTLDLPPTPVADQIFTATNTVLSFAATNLLANDTDPESDAVAVSAVSAASTNGGTVTLTNGVITYTPPANYAGADAFSYTATDALGASATGTVLVQVLAIHPGGTGVTVVPGAGVATVKFTGIPGVTYTVLRTLAVPGGWTEIGTATADASGAITFTDPNPPAAQAFYRTLKP
ncbi:MAG: cadherin-like domain-containing protein [Verrucomicrobia bacterium]|nr:cadherin-like domain-containing protein [Verrucomicrobiota bacterium]